MPTQGSASPSREGCSPAGSRAIASPPDLRAAPGRHSPIPDLRTAVLNSLITIALTLPAALAAAPATPSVTTDAPAVATVSTEDALPAADDGRGTPYVVNKSDNICGLDQPRQLTKPAKVDYQALLDATPEAKKIKDEKIDPESSEGITLLTKARARVLKACESVRAAQGHCSVWKVIRRRDGKALSDITDAVKRKL